MLKQVHEVVRLQQHVAKFGVGDAVLAADAGLDRIFGHHVIDGEMLAHVAQKFHHAELAEPGGVIHNPGRVALDLKVQNAGKLLLDAFQVGLHFVQGEQVAFGGTAAWIANHARATTCQGDRRVPVALHPGHRHHRHQVTNVQAVARRVEAVVERYFLFGQ